MLKIMWCSRTRLETVIVFLRSLIWGTIFFPLEMVGFCQWRVVIGGFSLLCLVLPILQQWGFLLLVLSLPFLVPSLLVDISDRESKNLKQTTKQNPTHTKTLSTWVLEG